MNSLIQTLEKIGKNDSLKQHEDLLEMLNSLDIKDENLSTLNLKTLELVCGLVPEDDSDEGNDNDEEEINA